MSNPLYLGVDGGQSSTTALIGDSSGAITGFGTAGPCYNLDEAVNAVRAAGGAGLTFQAACFGFSGGPDNKEEFLRSSLAIDRLFLTTDARIALTGAMDGGPGIITIAGTGSISYGSKDGKYARAGGWGYIYGDEGGAFDIARQAVRSAVRQHEGWGQSTLLHDRLLEGTGAKDANDLLHLFYTDEWPRSRVAQFAPMVDELAQQGDSVARDILVRSARHLALITGAVRNLLFNMGEPVHIATTGGVWGSKILAESFERFVKVVDGNFVAPAKHRPAAGALLEAYALDGLKPQLHNLPEFEK